MATSEEFIEYVCESVRGAGSVRYRKMFGEYMVYLDERPVLLVCDNTVYVKKLDCVAGLMERAGTGVPYAGAREHYILDIDDETLCREVLPLLAAATPLPKPKREKRAAL
ncbi:MAG TPA: transcriptional regulator [Synergistaceae bacterium]|nr:transcriptional regulator [Synergistaceae bacterium]